MSDKTTQPNNGGPAFPVPGGELPRTPDGYRRMLKPHTGMRLRDWFAGQALTTIRMDAAPGMPVHLRLLALASHAYAIADAMLAARAPQPVHAEPVLVLDAEARRYLEVAQEKLEGLQDEGPEGAGWKSNDLHAVIGWLITIRENAQRELDAQGRL